MKKTYLLMALAAGTLASCSLETDPVGSIPTDTALQTPSNFQAARQTLYADLKACVGATDFYNAPDIQADQFNAVTGFSNTFGEMYRWDFNTSTSTMSTVYGNYQGTINQANFIIDGYNKADLSNTNLFPDSSDDGTTGLPVARTAKGEAFFTRAYAIFGLSQYFCKAYDENADKTDGVSYSLKFETETNAKNWPARKSLAETYQQIYDDLDSAEVYITAKNTARSAYITLDAVAALRARVALTQGNWELAAQESDIVMTSGTYSLCSNETQLQNEWWMDGYAVANYSGTSEDIFRLAITSSSDYAGATGKIYLPYSDGGTPDYVPTKEVMDLYSYNDNRLNVFFTQVNVTTTTGAAGRVYCLNKFNKEGVVYLAMTSNDEYAMFVHEPKVFRLPEMYLIYAEASARLGNLEDAKDALAQLEKKRISGFKTSEFESKIGDDENKFMTELRAERQRELIGEGFRLMDLKRWGLGVKRGTPQQRDLCSNPGTNTTDLDIQPNNYRMVWPIPKHETDVNKQVKQNPGY